MKALLLCLTLACPALIFAENVEIKVGQTLKETIALLGKPVGTIELREKTLLLYPQGEVALRNDLVVEIDLMSDEAFAADQERLRIEREEWLVQKERDAERRIEEGENLKSSKMKSSAFAALPAKDRVDYWRSFQIRFPEIDVSEEISRALEGYESELAELKSQHRIAELEARVALAEKEAATARLEAQKAQQQAEANKNSNYYGLRYYTDPVIRKPYYYRPPTVTIYSNGTVTTTHNKKNNNVFRYERSEQSESTAERATRILQGGTTD
ncbi:MAG: hypothetical protein ACSHX4_13975 [Opitutaceae bacterium]